ncbi:MAG TPA: tannase/feruloyl esterase family alpha/beta hydrolase [Solirubrobacteraceae bacterium]|nr:tannase/feruloyl esterase family alpha/beta hydrolase [Solirubrobacteraceae bacterium]
MLELIRVRRAWGVSVLTGVAALVVIIALGSAGGGVAGAKTEPLVAASAKLVPISPIIKPKLSKCEDITRLTDLAANPEYPTAIASSTDMPAANGNPEYCDVKGMIAPQTQFDLQLPVSSWQGRYLQNGCGGYCGTVGNQTFPSCDAQLGGDFAMATDNEGHVTAGGLGGGGLWAFNDLKLRNEYGYESEQALYVVARQIIKDYYGQLPNRSYYNGCSDGGREAMEMAERYPDDFDGIIAGAPEIIAGPLNAEEQTWNIRVNTGPDGNAILTADKLPALHGAVLKFCAGDDGVNDGIITDPQDCDSKIPQILASVQCSAGTDDSSCLTPAQVNVARLFYQGPSDPRGRLLYAGGVPLGSELGWTVFELPFGGSGPTSNSLDYVGLSQPYLRYQLLRPGQLGPDPFQWQFTDQAFNSMFPAANTWDAMDTNLTAFYRHGGKLIMWQGWADNGIPPSGTVDYYDTMSRRMGAATTKFSRLYLFPSVYHCGGGYAGATTPDLIYPIVQWVEQGTAPGQLTISYKPSPNTTPFTRPVYPYPDIPKYNGSGDQNSASSFHAVPSPGAHYTNWYGNYLFYRPVGGRDRGYARRG